MIRSESAEGRKDLSWMLGWIAEVFIEPDYARKTRRRNREGVR